jgi:hypothetical protein
MDMPSGDLWTVDEERNLVDLSQQTWRATGHRDALEVIAQKLDRSLAAVSHRLERLTIWIDGHQLVQAPGTSSFRCLTCEDWYALDSDDGWDQRRAVPRELARLRRDQEQILALLRADLAAEH